MARFILILCVVAGLWWLLSVRSRPRVGRGAAPAEAPDTAAAARPDTMVACAHCGVHLPRREALLAADDGADDGAEGRAGGGEGDAVGRPHYCSEAHRQAGRPVAPRA